MFDSFKDLEYQMPELTQKEPCYQTLVHIIDQNSLKQLDKKYESISDLLSHDLKQNQLVWTTISNPTKRVLLVYKEIDQNCEKKQSQQIRSFVVGLMKEINSKKIKEIDLEIPETFSLSNLGTLFNSIIQNNYKFELKNKIEEGQIFFQRLEKINLVNKLDIKSEQVQYQLDLAKSRSWSQNLGNLRANFANTDFFLEQAKEISKLPNVTLTSIIGKDLLKENLNLIYNVGRGASCPPMLINLTYMGNPSNPKQMAALIGKGIVFDAGGINIKMSGGFFLECMFIDKCGAAQAMGIFKSVAEMKLPINVTCSLGMAQNSLGADAYRPSDIIKSHKGLTVEIGNTDAEGRLVLCDAMSWTQMKYKPQTMIELSTLTGASMIAVGIKMGCLFGNSDKLCQELLECAEKVDEPLWKMPLTDEHRNCVKGKNSDLTNFGGRFGGACTAAAYLENFVEKGVNWAHIDIAGPSYDQTTSNCTGFGVQLVVEYLKNKEIAK